MFSPFHPIKAFKALYNYKAMDFGYDRAASIRLGNLFSLLGFLISSGYSAFYYFAIGSAQASLTNEAFAFCYLLYFLFLSKGEELIGFLCFLLTFMAQMFFVVVFFYSEKSGFHLYYFLAGPAAHIIFTRDGKVYKYLVYSLAAGLFVTCEVLGDRYAAISLENHQYDLLRNSTAIIAIGIYYVLFETFRVEINAREKKLNTLARTDTLTGILNRRAFYDIAEKLINEARRNNFSIGVLQFDLDHFKSINDNYGHAVGDKVLQEVSTAVKNSVRSTDYFARFGGEEFVLLITHMSHKELETFAQKLCEAIAKLEFVLEGGKIISCTASFGIAALESKEAIDDVIKKSDEAMYRAKAEGRNRIASHF